jgi:FHS family Na+ dependent glucose MFS transporter 1
LNSQSNRPDLRNSFRYSAGYFAAFFAVGMVIASLGPTLPSLAENLNISLSSAGFLFTARSLGYLLGSLLVGRGYDRFPGNQLMAYLLFVAALMMFFIPVTPFLYLVAGLLLVTGVCLGGNDVGGNTLVMWAFGDKSGPSLNAMYLFAGVGGLISPLVIGRFLIAGLDFKWAYWMLGTLILPVALWLVTRPSPERRSSTHSTTSGQVNYLIVTFVGILFFIYVGIEVSFSGWIYTFTITSNLGSISTAAILTSVFWMALTFGRFIAIPIASRVHPMTILRGNMIGALLSLGLILLFPNSIYTVVIGTVGFGISLASNFPSTYSLAERYLDISGRMTGLLVSCGSLGAMFTPWFIGHFMERLSPIALVATLFVYVCIGLGVLAGFYYYTRNSSSLPAG